MKIVKFLKLFVIKLYGTNQEILAPNITRVFLEKKNVFNLIINLAYMQNHE